VVYRVGLFIVVPYSTLECQPGCDLQFRLVVERDTAVFVVVALLQLIGWLRHVEEDVGTPVDGMVKGKQPEVPTIDPLCYIAEVHLFRNQSLLFPLYGIVKVAG